MRFEGKNSAYLEILEIDSGNAEILNASKKSELSLLWFQSGQNQLTIDTVPYSMKQHDIISLTEFHQLEVKQISKAILIRWNRPFYCIVDHDSEVSCKGILYYGASSVPIISPSEEEQERLNMVLNMFLIEMTSEDNLQLEMLQMMLKRVLILCARIYKRQTHSYQDSKLNVDIIRTYNYLVEQHFKTKHTVNEYADLLNKSPKTLSNLFKKNGVITPLQFIQNRIMLEARRLLAHADKSISEIGYELGFSDVQGFSRFFKTKEGCSPQNFREKEILTTP